MTEKTQPKDAELLPCPFCGEAANHSFNSLYGDMSMASCKSCGATAYAPKWNRRAVLAKWGASHGQAPAQATPAAVAVPDEIDRLRAALVYVAFALHGTRQYMLAEGVTLIDGDTVRVSRDGWTVEASSNPLRQPEPQPSPAAQGDALDAARYRWLRRWKGQEHEPPFTVQHEIDGTLWGGDLDAAIDAAMNKGGA